MDSNTPEKRLDAAKSMHHSPEMQLTAYAAYQQEILNHPTSDTLLQAAAKAMYHSTSTSSEIYGEILQEPFE